jgi:hypothetical protein
VLELDRPERGWERFRQPFRRRAIAAAALDGRIYAIGGMDHEDDMLLEVDIYEPCTGEWTSGPRLPKGPMGGFGAAACVADDRLFVTTYAGHTLSARARQGSDRSQGRHFGSVRTNQPAPGPIG